MHAFENMKNTGICSLFLQFVSMVLSIALSVFLVIWYSNLIEEQEIKSLTDNTSKLELSINIGNFTTEMHAILNGSRWESHEELKNLLQLSTIVYIGLCILWFFGQFSLLASVKLEILDFVIVNTIILCTVTLYIIIHGLFISIIFFRLPNRNWNSIITTTATVVGMFLIAGFCAFSMALLVAWYNYIVYVNGSTKCSCFGAIVRLVKDKGHVDSPNEYTIPEATTAPRSENYILQRLQTGTDIPP